MAEEMFETDDVVAAEKADDKIFKEKDSVIGFVKDRYKRSEDSRYADEQRWLKAYRNYRGLYGSDVQFTDAEKSRIFVKVTKTKTLAAYGQIVDVLFGNNKFPLSVNPSAGRACPGRTAAARNATHRDPNLTGLDRAAPAQAP